MSTEASVIARKLRNYIVIENQKSRSEINSAQKSEPGIIKNIHFGKICPGSIRGNHYHHQSKEMLIIGYLDTWTLAWAKKDSDEISKKEFTGSGAVLIKVNEGIVHSVKNNGDKDLEIIALSNRIFSKESSDTFSKILLT